MPTEFQFKKHTKVVCDLEKGDRVKTDGFGYSTDKNISIIEDVKFKPSSCGSGVMVKISGYNNYIDSDWLIKV